MGEMEILGYVITSLITVGSLIAVVVKFTQPINDLRVVIQKLNDAIDSMKKDNDSHGKRLDEHGREIDKLNDRVGKMETKIEIYHGGDKNAKNT